MANQPANPQGAPGGTAQGFGNSPDQPQTPGIGINNSQGNAGTGKTDQESSGPNVNQSVGAQSDENSPHFPPVDNYKEKTQTTEKVGAFHQEEKQVEASSFGMGWVFLIVAILAVAGIFVALKIAKQKKRYVPPKPHYDENDRKLLELAKSISTIYKKT